MIEDWLWPNAAHIPPTHTTHTYKKNNCASTMINPKCTLLHVQAVQYGVQAMSCDPGARSRPLAAAHGPQTPDVDPVRIIAAKAGTSNGGAPTLQDWQLPFEPTPG